MYLLKNHDYHLLYVKVLTFIISFDLHKNPVLVPLFLVFLQFLVLPQGSEIGHVHRNKVWFQSHCPFHLMDTHKYREQSFLSPSWSLPTWTSISFCIWFLLWQEHLLALCLLSFQKQTTHLLRLHTSLLITTQPQLQISD